MTADVPDVPDPVDLEEQAIRRLSVAREVGRLDVSDRELIALRFGADLTARQIGELLGMTKNAVDVALHRALARLRARLGEQARRGSAESMPTVRDELG